ncbi:PAS domain-containing protein [Deltaproteobacteria bacterium TL4]
MRDDEKDKAQLLQELELARQKIAELEETYAKTSHDVWWQTLAKMSPVGIFLTDAQGAYLYINERWCELTGMSYRYARGSGWSQSVHLEDQEHVIVTFR